MDLNSHLFSATYNDHPGRAVAQPPALRHIWTASAQGRGTQTLRWHLRNGSWSVVVMNADGSPGVRADVTASARIPFLGLLGWTLAGLGVLFGGLAAVVLRRRELGLDPLRRPGGRGGLVLAGVVDHAEARLVVLGPGAVDDLDEVQLADRRRPGARAVRRARGGLEVGPAPSRGPRPAPRASASLAASSWALRSRRPAAPAPRDGDEPPMKKHDREDDDDDDRGSREPGWAPLQRDVARLQGARRPCA